MQKKILLFVLICSLGIVFFLFSQKKEPQPQDLLKFSHKYHLVEYAECADCHPGAASSSKASDHLLPDMEVCSECHDVESEEECTVCHFEDEDTWQALPGKTRELVFSHEFHLQQTDVTCETCHKNLDKVDFADSGSIPGMAQCAECHNNERATLECAACHTSTLNLRPVDHGADFLMAHKNIARMDQQACASCHVQNDCAECHEGAALLITSGSSNADVQTPFFPSIAGGTRGLVLARVHELNFRETHGLQAEGRTQECATCHETRSFCQDCHESEGVDVAGKPLWHADPDWGAIAGVVGTGGGLHAELAKRDIESCESCHSTQGDDPTCLLCHTDFDGVPGTDAKTHGGSFADKFGEGASFHDDNSALCYSCHTNTDQAGLGFCGYCHGAEVD